jgi:large subunit ribosomal protein L15
MDILSKLQPPEGAVTGSRRVGRGVGSGLGKTSARGQKGQKARSKGNINKKHFQGGQTPLQRRLPKRGFRNPLADRVANVNVGSLEIFDAGASVDAAALRDKRLIGGRFDMLKVLGHGDLTKKLTVTAHRFSAGAIEKIEKAGGKAVQLAPPPPRPKAGDDKKNDKKKAAKPKAKATEG